jgi:TP901 family phage tail tape measure protein
MGFAGQIFAARVAVGLAMPSPKAFSQAGQMIGGFASNMYTRLNKQSMDAAKKQLSDSQANLAKAKAGLQKHSNEQDKFLSNKAANAVGRLEDAYGDLGKSALKSAGAVKGLKGTIKSTKVKTKLFMNVNEDMKDAKDYQNMMKNFVKMNKAERAEVIKGYEARKIALDNRIAEADTATDAGKEAKAIAEAELKLLGLQLKEFRHLDGVRKDSDDEYYADKKKHLAEVEKATEELNAAEKDLEQQTKLNVNVQQKLTQAGNDFVVDMKRNFVEAVRESISVLTAFYYKLNENTQELIEFERELMNANSVFRVTNSQLFDVGDQVVQFGQEFGLEMQNGATGLYQLASAGLSAADAMEVLNDTLKLSMAVQGDHNTISKLVTQTLFGFEMEMNQASIVADKFAYAIQKSLIEYQDLASAVKFALPFFTTTGQSIDQLLGALQILTNRALEAGIAGRGLRQGVAELAESIGDNTARFREFGVEVTDAQGNMLQLTEIAANFHAVLDEGVINDTELLTSLIQDLNVRGATAFVHLVQASDEFTEAVKATAGAGGELDEMIKVQNQSIGAQMQILRNNIGMMFLFRDATYDGTNYLNAFHEAVVLTVQDMRNLLVVQLEDGTFALTEFGTAIQTFAINGVKEMRTLLQDIIPILQGFVSLASVGFKLFQIYMIPVKMIIKALEIMGPTMTKVVLAFHLLSKILPITTIAKLAYVSVTWKSNFASIEELKIKMADVSATPLFISSGLMVLAYKKLTTAATYKNIGAKIMELMFGDKEIAQKLIMHIIYGNELVLTSAQYALAEKSIISKIYMLWIDSQGIKTSITKWFWGWKNFILDNLVWKAKKGNMTMSWAEYGLNLLKLKLMQKGLRQASLNHTVESYMYALKRKSLKQALYEYYLQIKKNILDGITNALSAIKVFFLGKENDEKKIGIFLTIKNTISQWADNIAQAWGNVSRAVGSAFLWAYTIPGKIYNTILNYAQAVSEWWVNLSVEGGNIARAKAVIILIAKNAVMVVAAAVMITYAIVQAIVNIASWSFTASLLANPVTWIVLGVVALVAALVYLGYELYKSGELWTYFGMIAKHTMAAIMWPFKVLGGMILSVGESVYGILEGPLFKMMLFVTHFFKMIVYYVKKIGAWFFEKIIDPVIGGFKWLFGVIKEWVIDPILGFFGKVKEGIEAMKNPLFTLGELMMKYVFNPVLNAVDIIWDYVKKILGGIKDVMAAGGDVVAGVIETLSFAEGGYVRPMANGGLAQHGPYMVGEKGPELFMPEGAGRIVPNKDLNTQRVKNMLQDSLPAGIGADKAFQRMNANITVEKLEVKKANLRDSRIGVDTFGGNI